MKNLYANNRLFFGSFCWHDECLPTFLESNGKIRHRSLFHVSIVKHTDEIRSALSITILWLDITIAWNGLKK